MTTHGRYGQWEEAFSTILGLTSTAFCGQFADSRPTFERIVTGATVKEADREGRDGLWTSTALHPGLNLVGWLEAPIPVEDLFDAMPQAEALFVWQAGSKQWLAVARGGLNIGGLETLQPGMGFWLRISGEAPVRWDRRLAIGDPAVTYHPGFSEISQGRNLVAWTGNWRAAEAIGEDASRFQFWDPAR